MLNTENGDLVRWTYSEVGGLNTDSFIIPELIHYETFDMVNGKPRMIPAFYYRPQSGDEPYPVLVDIHGGPEGQERLPTQIYNGYGEFVASLYDDVKGEMIFM